MSLPLLVPDWPAPPNVRAAMTTRQGGVSEGVYASFNLGGRTDDDDRCVQENRKRLVQALDLPVEPFWLRQVHGRRVATAGAGPREPVADASVARESGTVCAVLAADCLPVLFCEESGAVVAAAHAGWRGLASGVLESTVEAMSVSAGTVMAWLGPAIGPEAFEVGEDVRAAFCGADPEAGAHFRLDSAESSGKFRADLWGLARRRLAACGVSRVFGGGRCTFSEPEHFFSHRRDGPCGRMSAVIWLAASPQESRRSG